MFEGSALHEDGSWMFDVQLDRIYRILSIEAGDLEFFKLHPDNQIAFISGLVTIYFDVTGANTPNVLTIGDIKGKIMSP